jgi:BASS family bile acid:Na+ symporter
MIKKAIEWFANLYGIWVMGIMILCFFYPQTLEWFGGEWVRGALTLVMLAMGLTLHPSDFREVVRLPAPIAVGFLAQYSIMPATSWAVSHLLGLPPALAVGLILVGCAPGGTASNVVTYLARANVALSVLLTMVSTIMATVMTPLLVKLLAGQYVPVDAWAMLWSTAQIVLIPLALGVYLNYRFHGFATKVSVVGPAVAVIGIALIAGSMTAQNVALIRENAVVLTVATFLLHATGFALGYWIVRLLRYSKIDARTISIEVGMQNSGLAMVLAQQHFSAATAAPAAFASILHTVLGSALAMFWRFRKTAMQPTINSDDH